MEDNNKPKHIGIILDGNRRYAKKLMMKPWDGHISGAKNLRKLLEWALELGIEELTLYCLSMQNLKREKTEVDFLMKIFREEFEQLEKSPKLSEYEVQINFLGRINLLPEDLHDTFQRIMNNTKDHKKLKLNFCIAYGGREEIVDAVNKAIDKGDKVDEESFKQFLYSPDDPDLIIRTGGEQRTSNFLPWQSTYSEWFFIEKMWPEFGKEDLIQVINEYSEKRQRRFGK